MNKTPLILIVDDDQAIIKLLTDLFTIEGYQIISTNWGNEALTIVEKQHPDLVILDILLPDIDGFEVTQRMKAKRGSAFTPIIFLSENAGREQRLKGLSLGAEDFIAKPFDIEELVLRVRNVLTRFANAAQTNPVSGLPENDLLDNALDICLGSNGRRILLIFIRNMDQIRRSQGFLRADDTLRQVAARLDKCLHKHGDSASLLGQLGPNEFVLILPDSVSPQDIDSLRKSLQELVDFSHASENNQESPPSLEVAMKCYQQEEDGLHAAGDLRSLVNQMTFGDA